MRERLKTLWTALLRTLGLTCLLLAATADAQTYVRPSKGAPIVVFAHSNSPAGTQLSAVYDMSAFVELQFDATLTNAGFPSEVVSFNVGQLARYVKIQVEYPNTSGQEYAVYTVLGSDTPGGAFVPLSGPSSREVVSFHPNANLTDARLSVTPIPYGTTLYSRPSKGNPIVTLDRPLGSFVNPRPIDMRGFAAVSITVEVTNPIPGTDCDRYPTILIYGAPSLTGQYRLLSTPNAIFVIGATIGYIVNVSDNYIAVVGNTVATGTGNVCTFKVTATPLPYTVPSSDYPRRAGAVGFEVLTGGTPGPAKAIPTFSYYQRLRIQNTGAGPAECGAKGLYPYRLAGETAGVGTGGVLTLDNYAGDLECIALTAAGAVITYSAY